MIQNDSFCLMPWIHLYIDTNGFVKACCNSSITFGNIREKSIREIWEDDAIKTFRKNILSGIKDKRCSSCYKREEAGKKSIRTETLEKYSHITWQHSTTEDGSSKESKPIYFDIRFGNVCNLKCRTCWHGASSSWFEEAKLLNNNIGDKAIIKASENNLEIIEQIIDLNAEIEEIYFAGGEPLMMEEHYAFLAALEEFNQTKVHLRYNTNLSTLKLKNYDAINYWKAFENITLSVSIDNLHEKAGYIRKGLNWNQFIDNVKRIQRECPHIHLEIAPTISIFSILNISELHRYFVEHNMIGINDIYLNVLDRPSYYNIKTLPISIKELAKERIDNHILWLHENKASQMLIDELASLVTYMQKDDLSTQLSSFSKYTFQLDEWRNEKFENTFPELATLIKKC